MQHKIGCYLPGKDGSLHRGHIGLLRIITSQRQSRYRRLLFRSECFTPRTWKVEVVRADEEPPRPDFIFQGDADSPGISTYQQTIFSGGIDRNRSGSASRMEIRPFDFRKVVRDCSANAPMQVPGAEVGRSTAVAGASSSICRLTAGMVGRI